MKRLCKVLGVDVLLVVVNVLFFTNFNYSFSPANFGAFLITISVLIFSVVIHCVAHTEIPEDKSDVVEQMNAILQNEDLQFETYMTRLRGIKKANPEFNSVINTFIAQIESFSNKEEALLNLIDLNDGKAKEFLVARNNDVQIFLIKNLKKFVKRLIAYSAKTKKNRSSSIEQENGVQEILSQNNELIDLYDQLLDEVARMGDDFDIQDPGLQNVIENLQTLRNDTEEESDDEDEIKLFVTRSGRG